jgi:hypothetical protein
VGTQQGVVGKPLVNQSLVEDLKELAAGVYYPTKARGTDHVDGSGHHCWEVELSRAVANAPLPAERFTFDLPRTP